MSLFRRNPVVRTLVVVGMTVIVLFLSAILLPPKGSNAMHGAEGGKAPATSSH